LATIGDSVLCSGSSSIGLNSSQAAY